MGTTLYSILTYSNLPSLLVVLLGVPMGALVYGVAMIKLNSPHAKELVNYAKNKISG
jgi:hypothetical protein